MECISFLLLDAVRVFNVHFNLFHLQRCMLHVYFRATVGNIFRAESLIGISGNIGGGTLILASYGFMLPHLPTPYTPGLCATVLLVAAQTSPCYLAFLCTAAPLQIQQLPQHSISSMFSSSSPRTGQGFCNSTSQHVLLLRCSHTA